MAASTPTPLHKQSQELFIKYYKTIQDNGNSERGIIRSRFEEIDKIYQREMDQTTDNKKAKIHNKLGDSDKFKNIQVPVVMPQVEAAVTYQTSVFLTGSPLFGVVSSPAFIDEALQLETIIDEQAIVGGWTRDLILFFRDGYKYNFAPIEVSWDRQVTANLETDIKFDTKQAKPVEVIWEGNNIKRLDPYNTFVDQSVPPTEVYRKGEYAGYTELVSMIELKAIIAGLPDKIIANIKPAFESSCNNSIATSSDAYGYYVPYVNPEVDTDREGRNGTNWLQWAGMPADSNRINYKNSYELTTLYCKILPGEFGLRVPNSNTPQIYKLLIVNHEIIIYAERQTNAHNFLPILIGQPLEDGLGYQTKSLATNAEPFQTVASAYMNSILHGRRRAVTDRVLFDPSRILAAHINSDNPSAKIPVRPAAYGKAIGEAVYQFPYRDDQSQYAMQQIQTLLGMANSLAGQNQASQGQFVKGNKTLHEFESVMQNANGRDQLASILLEAQIFTPMKQIIKTNILQYQGGTTIYNRDKRVVVEVDPIKLRKAVLSFKLSDGLLPSSKIMNADTWTVALQSLATSPQLSSGFNLAPMFSYLMKTQGADVSDFEKSQEQVAFEQALGSWERVAMQAAEKGIDPKEIPEQPKPEDFGYNPQKKTPEEVE